MACSTLTSTPSTASQSGGPAGSGCTRRGGEHAVPGWARAEAAGEPAAVVLLLQWPRLRRCGNRSSQGLGPHHPPTPSRTPASWLMACFHIITAIIGAGVLGLPHALSMLGWLGGVVSLVAFFAVTLVCSFMLADMYEVDGRKHPTYGDAVVCVLGARPPGMGGRCGRVGGTRGGALTRAGALKVGARWTGHDRTFALLPPRGRRARQRGDRDGVPGPQPGAVGHWLHRGGRREPQVSRGEGSRRRLPAGPQPTYSSQRAQAATVTEHLTCSSAFQLPMLETTRSWRAALNRMVVHSHCAVGDKQCGSSVWQMSLVFGCVQLFFSQMPTLESAWWSSMVGAAMSVLYSSAAFGMGAVRGEPRPHSRRSLSAAGDCGHWQARRAEGVCCGPPVSRHLGSS